MAESFVEILPEIFPTASVIWLHGLGADGHDFESIVPALQLPKSLPVRFVFPHAPVRPVTLNGGMVMRAWYDIESLESLDKEDALGIHDSQDIIERLIEREHALGIDKKRIILAGFSQGGAIALQTGLRHVETLGGVMALSSYLPLRHTIEQETSEANKDTPIFMAHGSFDPIVPLHAAEMSRQYLTQLGYAVEWHTYPMAHAVCDAEISAISHWLREILAR